MKISEVVVRLVEISKQHGDIEVGIHNDEFDLFGSIRGVYPRNARRFGDWPDEDALSDVFVALSHLPESHTSIHDNS